MKCQDDGVVLRRIPFRDTSMVVHLFTRHHGRLALVARGARAGKQAPRAALSGLHTVDLHYALRPGAELGHLAGAEILTGRHLLPGRPLGVAAAQVLLEAVARLVAVGDPHPELFTDLESALNLLEQGENPLAVAAVGLSRLARGAGYGWRLDGCAGCGRCEALDYFSIKRSQLVCAACGRPYAPYLIGVEASLRHLLATLAWPDAGACGGDEMYGRLYILARAVLERHAGCVLQADAALRRILLWDTQEGLRAPPSPFASSFRSLPQEGIHDR